jgi:hypothetical protein
MTIFMLMYLASHLLLCDGPTQISMCEVEQPRVTSRAITACSLTLIRLLFFF